MFKIKQFLPHKRVSATAESERIIKVLQDFAREDFINPFAELSRIKLQAAKLAKELNTNKGENK